MNHSDIVKDLLHKLSKNELLLQDGGNHHYYNKVNRYRNQLNGLYGAGQDEDTMTTEIMGEIDKLIPISVLEQFVITAEQQISRLVTEKQRLEKEIDALKASGQAGDTTKNAEIIRLDTELQKVQAEMAGLTQKLQEAEQKLTEKETEILSLKQNIQKIHQKVSDVKAITINSDPVKALLDRLRGTPAPASGATFP